MDMHAQHPEQRVFHLSGRRQGGGVLPIDGLDLRPALLAPYRDLGALRHDFPIVLVDHAPPGEPPVRTLSSLVNEVLREVAPRGIEGERLRRHGLQLETEIRRAVDAGARGLLSELWDAAAARLGEREGEALEQVLTLHGAGALKVDGEVLGCHAAMPTKLVTHLWRAALREKTKRFQADASRLARRLADILRAAFAHSQAGLAPQALAASVGGAHQSAFDFEALSRIVARGAPADELSPERRERLTRALHVLETQRFFAPFGSDDDEPGDSFDFDFESCAAAALAFRQRLPALVDVVKALAIAELEVAGRYRAQEHDAFFEGFGEQSLTASDLERFPDYLVCIPPERNDAAENAALMQMLSSGMPVKVLVQTTDLIEEAALGTGRFAFGIRSARLATTAMGLGGMFVLQSGASDLPALAPRIARGLDCGGPALFSVFTGTAAAATALPPYLSAAAAMQSRAFPAFSYDARAGGNWAERFSLENNPEPEDDWSVQTLDYCDEAQQRASEPIAFTFVDFALTDRRHAPHFALVPRDHWSAEMLPVAQWLALPEAEASSRVPYVLAVDASDTLQRVIADAAMMQAARRCLLLWHRLQEHGGVHDSHAERLLAKEKAAWQAQAAATATAAPVATPVAAPVASTVAPSAAPAAPQADTAPAEETPAHSRDEAWIETARCPSCNECQLINDRLFGYNERKQAFIKDLAAGTYRQLVEAAESCQVAIIHPGAPRDPNEPGLAELLERAEPFR